MKLVINSYAKYKKPLATLLASMVDASFRRWGDVVVVMSGAGRTVWPKKTYLPAIRDNVTIVKTPLNAYDYTGLAVLWHLRNHPLIRAKSYFYMHDTARVGRNFTRLYGNFSHGIRLLELRKPKGLYSNVCVFGRGLPLRWKDTYDKNFTKAEAVNLERGGWKYTARGARPLIYWARGGITKLPGQVNKGMEDPYHTGSPRHVEWYPAFDVYKYVLGGGFGNATRGKPKPSSR